MRRSSTTTVAAALVGVLALSACTTNEPPLSGQGPSVPGASGERVDGDRPGGVAVELPDDLVLAGSLRAFDACDAFLAHVQEEALRIVTPWGLDGGYGYPLDADVLLEDGETGGRWTAAQDDVAAGDAMDVDGGAAVAGEDFSGTNVQEAGVDEPDIAKTDGSVLYVVAGGRLVILDVRGDVPDELASIDLRDAWDAQLLLDGDRLLVTSGTYAAIPFAGERVSADAWRMPPWGGATTVTLLDVSDPSDPVAIERLTVDGHVLASRLVDGVARVVVRTEQGNLPWEYPQGSGFRAERRALEANRELIRASVAEDWIPWYVHETADGEQTEGPLLACNRIVHPREFAGLGILDVLTIDLADGGLRPGDEALGLLAGGETIYASRGRLYAATTAWVDGDDLSSRARERRLRDVTTELHAFDIADPRTVEYLGSGAVPGTLLSQWAMSEHDDVLRVASTLGDPWGWDGPPSESLVTTLALRAGDLVQLGQVDGLGLTERIYAVRFIGDVGYVVTFRETDPLYAVDLSDPTKPRVEGELKIPGYSAYLHPVGDDLLLGVGQDADLDGRTLGTQFSLFDVRDLTDPQRIDKVTLGDATSEVEHDHRAFLHWPATGLNVAPFSRWGWQQRGGWEEFVAGAVGFTADRQDGLKRVGLLSHRGLLRDTYQEMVGEDWLDELVGDPGTDVTGGSDPAADRRRDDGDWIAGDTEVVAPDGLRRPEMWFDLSHESQIRRTVVIGDRLLTISGVGVMTHDLETLADLGGLAFDR